MQYQNDIIINHLIKLTKMENKKEIAFSGNAINGFLMLFVNLAVLILSIVGIIYSIVLLDGSDGAVGGWLLAASGVLLIVNIICWQMRFDSRLIKSA